MPSPGCESGGSEAEAAKLTKLTIDVEGTERWYLLTAPAGVADPEPLPLVVDYHGLAEGADVHAQMTQLSALGTEEGFAVAQPNGVGSPVGWATATDDDAHGDQAFTDAMLDEIGRTRCIDVSRVYATGLSNGAFMSSSVACTQSDRFAAVAPVAGLQALKPCQADRPVPVLTFHGTSDPILLFNGGVDGDFLGNVLNRTGTTATTQPRPYDVNGEGYPLAVSQWAERNGCDADPTDTNVTDEIIHRVYSCPDGADVEFYIVIGGGHSWPGSEFSAKIEQFVGPTNMDIDASQVIWDFFQRFQLPA